MGKIKGLGLLAALLALACALSSCKTVGTQLLEFIMDDEPGTFPAIETQDADRDTVRETPPARGTETQAPPVREAPLPPTEPPAEPTAAPAAAPTEPVQPPYEGEGFFTGPGWFEGVMGSRFYLPEGFAQQSEDDFMQGMGTHTYDFWHQGLAMEITVFECSSIALAVSPQEEFEVVSSSGNVTYSQSGDGYYVVSGYSDSEHIYYTRVDYDEAFYHSVSFHYPVATSQLSEEVLLEFLRNYSTD